MGDLANFISELFKGLDIRRRWLAITVISAFLILLVIGFEYLTGFFYYRNLAQKISLLKELHTLSKDGVPSDPNLSKIYLQAVQELRNHQINLLTAPSLVLTNSVTFWKAASGASLGALFFVYAIFAVSGREKANSVLGAGFVAVIFGVIAAFIPTIYNPWVNYIGFPAILAILLILIGRSTTTNT